jgi:hypothetical protein
MIEINRWQIDEKNGLTTKDANHTKTDERKEEAEKLGAKEC